MTPNERFAKAAKLNLSPIWVETCDGAGYYSPVTSPDFTDAREVLKVMMERGDYDQFLLERIFKYGWTGRMVCNLIIDHTGRLRDLATEWMEGRK